MSNEQTDALEQALFLLDTFAGEGVGHIYGNGQELDASDVCTELADAFDLQCEPGWHRVLAARLTATPSPSTDTLERREAMIAQNRTEFVADGDATRRKTDAEMCAERRDAATLLALTPSPRVDEGRIVGEQIPPFVSAPTFDDRSEQRVVINGCLFLRADFAATLFATTPADPRGLSILLPPASIDDDKYLEGWVEGQQYLIDNVSADPRVGKMEADLAELRGALNKAAHRFDYCAQMIDRGFNISGTLRLEHVEKAKHFALEARSTLSQIEGSGR